MQTRFSWWFATLLVAVISGALLVGFRANPAAQPQRVSDLVARIEALEEESRSQKEALDALAGRVDALEGLGVKPDAITFNPDVVIPRAWTQSDSGDGVVRYWHDPAWELASDEPGTLDLWLDDETSLFFAWDWSADLLLDLHGDERFFTLFEEDLVWSDDSIQMEIAAKGALEFMGYDAHYWDINMQSVDSQSGNAFYSRMLIIFYPCSELASCNVTLMAFSEEPDAEQIVEGFSQAEWDFLNTFANGVEFLNVGKASMNANANLRSCPATDCEVVGRLVRGEIVEVVAVSDDGEWMQLESGEWVAAGSVTGAPRDLPVVRDTDDI